MTYPTVNVYLAVDGAPLADEPTWTDVTAYVCHEPMSMVWGRPPGADQFQPGRGSLSLINLDGRFDPEDASGAYYPNFTLRTRIKVEATHDAVAYPLAFGYLTSIQQRWNYRAEQIADVQWIDSLGVLATMELPESAWDYQIEIESDKVAWHKLGSDTTSTARDYSGNENHGRYVTYEGVDGPLNGQPTPLAVLNAGVTDSVLPLIPRPARSWGKMVAEADQPMNGGTADGDNWRSTAVVCAQATAALMEPGEPWTVELLCTVRQGYALSRYAVRTGSNINIGMVQWGEPVYQVINGFGVAGQTGPMWRFGAGPGGEPRAVYYRANATGIWPEDLTGFTFNATDPTAVALVAFTSAGDGYVSCYVNGTYVGVWDLSTVPLPRGWPMTIAESTGRGGSTASATQCTWWGTIQDVVAYNRQLVATDCARHWVAATVGRIQSTTTTPLTTGQVMGQVFVWMSLSGSGVWDAGNGTYDSGGHTLRPGAFERRTVLDYFRAIEISEAGAFFYGPDGSSWFRFNRWMLDTRSAEVQWTITDDDVVTGDDDEIGHTGGSLSLDDARLLNDATVNWTGGTAQVVKAGSVASYGRFRGSVATILDDAVEARTRAEWEVWRHARPHTQPSSLTVEPSDDRSWTAALGLMWGDRVRVIMTRPDGSQWDRHCWVEQIAHSVDMGQGSWRTTLGLSLADFPEAPFLVGSSVLDGDDAVWY